MFDLTGKNALITGASGGIGGAVAAALHAAGASVTLSGTREAPLRELAASLGERAHVVTANLGDPAEVDDESAFRRRDPNAPAEESALHIVDDDEQSPEEEDIDLQDEDIEYED